MIYIILQKGGKFRVISAMTGELNVINSITN